MHKNENKSHNNIELQWFDLLTYETRGSEKNSNPWENHMRLFDINHPCLKNNNLILLSCELQLYVNCIAGMVYIWEVTRLP